MSGKHGHKPFEGHMHDYEAHITAVEEDLGGGLMANFWLEGQYSSDTGAGPGGLAGTVDATSTSTAAAVAVSGGLRRR